MSANSFSFWETSSPDPLPVLRPWTPLRVFSPSLRRPGLYTRNGAALPLCDTGDSMVSRSGPAFEFWPKVGDIYMATACPKSAETRPLFPFVATSSFPS